jgi:hypothetical protein
VVGPKFYDTLIFEWEIFHKTLSWNRLIKNSSENMINASPFVFSAETNELPKMEKIEL